MVAMVLDEMGTGWNTLFNHEARVETLCKTGSRNDRGLSENYDCLLNNDKK